MIDIDLPEDQTAGICYFASSYVSFGGSFPDAGFSCVDVYDRLL